MPHVLLVCISKVCVHPLLASSYISRCQHQHWTKFLWCGGGGSRQASQDLRRRWPLSILRPWRWEATVDVLWWLIRRWRGWQDAAVEVCLIWALSCDIRPSIPPLLFLSIGR
jgi:hypothetical protein